METSLGAKELKALKKELYEDIEKVMYLWFLQEHSRVTPISGPILLGTLLSKVSSRDYLIASDKHVCLLFGSWFTNPPKRTETRSKTFLKKFPLK